MAPLTRSTAFRVVDHMTEPPNLTHVLGLLQRHRKWKAPPRSVTYSDTLAISYDAYLSTR